MPIGHLFGPSRAVSSIPSRSVSRFLFFLFSAGLFVVFAAPAASAQTAVMNLAYDSPDTEINDMTVFNGNLYAAGSSGNAQASNPEASGMLYRLDGQGNWQPVAGSSHLNEGYNGIKAAQGALFAMSNSVYNSATGHVAKIYRSTDGVDFIEVLNDPYATDAQISTIVDYNGALYAFSYSHTGGGRIYRSTDAGLSWTIIKTGFYRGCIRADSAGVFNGLLYAGTYGGSGTGRIAYSNDGINWTEVGPAGYDWLTLAVQNQRLYAATYEPGGSKVFVSADGASWSQVWQTGTSWGLVNKMVSTTDALYLITESDGRIFKHDGTNWPVFYDDALEKSFRAATVFNGKLYAGTVSSAGQPWGSPPNGMGRILVSAADVADITAPSITNLKPEGWLAFLGHAYITASFADAGTGVDSATVQVKVDGASITPSCTSSATGVSCPVPAVSHGMHSIEVTVSDRAGNTAGSSGAFGYDATMPQVSATPLSWTNTSVNTVTVNVSEPESGVIASTIRMLNSSNVPLTGCTITAYSPGNASISCPNVSSVEGNNAYYVNFNTSNSGWSIGFGFRVDTIAPAISNIEPSGWIGSNSLTVRADIFEAGSGYSWSNSNMTVDGAIHPWRCMFNYNGHPTVSCDIYGLAEGAHTVAISVVDTAGNVAAATQNIMVDLTDPAVSNIRPSGTVYVSDPVLEADLIDLGSGIAAGTATMALDGGAPLSGCWVSDSLISCQAAGLAAGHHSIQVNVRDRAGRSGSGSGMFDVVLNRPPALAPVGDRTVDEGATLSFFVNATDPDGDPLALSASGLPSGATFDPSTGVFSWTPGYAQAGIYTGVTFTVSDDGAPPLTDGESITINVNDVNRPPIVSGCADATIAEGQTAACLVTASDPDGDMVSMTATAGTLASFGDGSWAWSLQAGDGPSDSQTIVVTAGDGRGGSTPAAFDLTVNNVAPAAGAISAPIDPMQVGSTVAATASFTDAGTADTHIASWNWGDGAATAGVVDETGGQGSVSGSHAYSLAGVYAVTLTVTDKDGGSSSSVFQFAVVYDPNAGFVTGGGWIDSPAGSLASDPGRSGRANFGFNSGYQKGATVPTGQTEFQFKLGNLNFHSTSYDWLVVAGAKAQYKGTGTINSSGSYAFMLAATDGQLNGTNGADRFRIRIWDKISGAIVYDNQMGGADDSDPVTGLGGGSIVIHQQ